MRMTRKTLLLIAAAVLCLTALAAVAAVRAVPSEAAPEAGSEPTTEYLPEASADPGIGQDPDGDADISHPATLADESLNESMTGDIIWPENMLDPADPEENPEEPSEPAGEDPAEPEDPKRPLGGHLKTYSLSVTVVDGAGYPVPNAEVTVYENSYVTGESGQLTIESELPLVEIIVSCSGYMPYYEELDLTTRTLPLTVVMDRATDIRSLLNSAELHPDLTDNEDLNHFLEVLFGELFRPGMDTYDQVKACYDWLIENTYYRSPNHWDNAKNYWLCAYQTMVDGYGTCNCYSAAFTAMLRRIGLECYVVTGYTTANEGGYTSHDWTTVCINDKWYIFDAQVEDAIAGRTRSKKVTYVRFCLAEPHAKYRYSISSRANCVKRFQAYLDEHAAPDGN